MGETVPGEWEIEPPPVCGGKLVSVDNSSRITVLRAIKWQIHAAVRGRLQGPGLEEPRRFERSAAAPPREGGP